MKKLLMIAVVVAVAALIVICEPGPREPPQPMVTELLVPAPETEYNIPSIMTPTAVAVPITGPVPISVTSD